MQDLGLAEWSHISDPDEQIAALPRLRLNEGPPVSRLHVLKAASSRKVREVVASFEPYWEVGLKAEAVLAGDSGVKFYTLHDDFLQIESLLSSPQDHRRFHGAVAEYLRSAGVTTQVCREASTAAAGLTTRVVTVDQTDGFDAALKAFRRAYSQADTPGIDQQVIGFMSTFQEFCISRAILRRAIEVSRSSLVPVLVVGVPQERHWTNVSFTNERASIHDLAGDARFFGRKDVGFGAFAQDLGMHRYIAEPVLTANGVGGFRTSARSISSINARIHESFSIASKSLPAVVLLRPMGLARLHRWRSEPSDTAAYVARMTTKDELSQMATFELDLFEHLRMSVQRQFIQEVDKLRINPDRFTHEVDYRVKQNATSLDSLPSVRSWLMKRAKGRSLHAAVAKLDLPGPVIATVIPDEAEELLRSIASKLRAGMLTQAERNSVSQALQLYPLHASALEVACDIALIDGEFNEAIGHSQMLTRVRPFTPTGFFLLAHAYTHLNSMEHAKWALDYASQLELRPEQAGTLISLAANIPQGTLPVRPRSQADEEADSLQAVAREIPGTGGARGTIIGVDPKQWASIEAMSDDRAKPYLAAIRRYCKGLGVSRYVAFELTPTMRSCELAGDVLLNNRRLASALKGSKLKSSGPFSLPGPQILTGAEVAAARLKYLALLRERSVADQALQNLAEEGGALVLGSDIAAWNAEVFSVNATAFRQSIRARLQLDAVRDYIGGCVYMQNKYKGVERHEDNERTRKRKRRRFVSDLEGFFPDKKPATPKRVILRFEPRDG